jgi:hypothetical protein
MQSKPRFTHAATEDLYRYWDRRRAGRPAPDRSEIEPGDIRAILPDTFILEVEENGGFTWRLAGTRVCALHCRELKGRDFLADWAGKENAAIRSLLEAVVRESAVGIVQFAGRTERGQRLDLECVFLPLRVFGRPTCRVLGALGAKETPYWLGLYPPTARDVTGVRMVWPTGRTDAPAGTFGAPRIEPPATVLSGVERTRRYRHLMVVDGGKS